MSRCVTWLKTRDFFVKGFWKPYFVLTGLNFLILVSWFFCSHSFLGNGLKELFQRSLELLCRVDGPCACGLMEGGVIGDFGFWCPSEWLTEGLPHPIVYFQLLSGAFIMGDLCAVLIPPQIVTFCLFKIMCLILARSLLPLVLPVTLQREFQSLCAFKLPRPFFSFDCLSNEHLVLVCIHVLPLLEVKDGFSYN